MEVARPPLCCPSQSIFLSKSKHNFSVLLCLYFFLSYSVAYPPPPVLISLSLSHLPLYPPPLSRSQPIHVRRVEVTSRLVSRLRVASEHPHTGKHTFASPAACAIYRRATRSLWADDDEGQGQGQGQGDAGSGGRLRVALMNRPLGDRNISNIEAVREAVQAAFPEALVRPRLLASCPLFSFPRAGRRRRRPVRRPCPVRHLGYLWPLWWLSFSATFDPPPPPPPPSQPLSPAPSCSSLIAFPCLGCSRLPASLGISRLPSAFLGFPWRR